jgi:Mn2+/Fe2+ NRAMP family transporter
LAGEFAYVIFALGILGTGFMAVPVLAGSAAYAVGEAMHWPVGLARQPKEARAFYATLVVATAVGTAINFLPVDPIRALYWSAVINGVLAAPIIVVMMNLASSRRVMARFTLTPWLHVTGWITAAIVALCVVGLFGALLCNQGRAIAATLGRDQLWSLPSSLATVAVMGPAVFTASSSCSRVIPRFFGQYATS